VRGTVAVGPASCPGCGAPINVWFDGWRPVHRDLIADGNRRHLCADPAKRERIEMSQDQYSYRCPNCGVREVAVTTWRRIVEFPDVLWQSPSWDDALDVHVCADSGHRPKGPRPTTFRTVD
jgi:hypothetical protein